MKIEKPIIKLMPDTKSELNSFRNKLNNDSDESVKDLINNYPTVYIHSWKKDDKFEVYVGETNDFFQRTEKHYESIKDVNVWQHNLETKNASLYVIAHPHFNKSLTLDVENRLIHYLSGCNSVAKVHNARCNPQNKYFLCEEFDVIFSKIWKQLRKCNEELFLSESEIKDSAIYKSSPLHKLNPEQLLAKEKILNNIDECLLKDTDHQLVFVQGIAGTGKTVLMSSMFYDLINRKGGKDIESAIIVNHNEQVTAYEGIITKLDLAKNKEKLVFKSTPFINLFKDKKNSPKKRDKLYDVVFVDEAHLLLSRKNQAYTEENCQLMEIMKYAKVVVAMFHKKQILTAEQYLETETIKYFINLAKKNNSFIELSLQMRMNVNKDTENWLNNLCDNGIIEKLPKNIGKYEIKIFDSPADLEKAIIKKASNPKTALSRIIATYDWKYSGVSRPAKGGYWNVTIGDWTRPWNYELLTTLSSKEKKQIKNLAWAEQPHTIKEIGSTYTIQGFDLNYAGVILGPSVKYRNGKIIFDPKLSCNDRATQKRTLSNGTRKSFAEELLQNEFGVLLTRGVNGLYIYACDDELRNKLKQCI